jgi:hypothetical protein
MIAQLRHLFNRGIFQHIQPKNRHCNLTATTSVAAATKYRHTKQRVIHKLQFFVAFATPTAGFLPDKAIKPASSPKACKYLLSINFIFYSTFLYFLARDM